MPLAKDSVYLDMNELIINKYLINGKSVKCGIPSIKMPSPIGVTLHNTGRVNAPAGVTQAEQYTAATVNGNMGSCIVHYYVDEVGAWQILDETLTSWHAATGATGRGNVDTISIECIMENVYSEVSQKAMDNCAKLVAYIFKKYNWTVENNLYTHNYWTNYLVTGKCNKNLFEQSKMIVSTTAKKLNSTEPANPSGKYCPAYIIPQWKEFTELINKYMTLSSRYIDYNPEAIKLIKYLGEKIADVLQNKIDEINRVEK